MGPGIALLTALVTSTGTPPGANPALIDPMDPGAGDFLDLDLTSYVELGLDSYRDGDWSMAARYFLAYLSRNSSDSGVIYNLACCYGLLGEGEMAAVYILRAFSAGFTDTELVRGDPDFDGVRGHPAFEAVMAELDRVTAVPPEYTGDWLIFPAMSASRCLYRLPDGYDGSLPVPLVMGLHGHGDSAENFIRLWGLFDSPEFIYACPEGPYAVQVYGNVGRSWFLAPGGIEDILEFDLISTTYVMSAIDSLRSVFNISRVYIMGFSQGCGLTWLTGMTEPGELSGVIGLGGRLDRSWIPEHATIPADGLPAFVANGTTDQRTGIDAGEESAVILEDHGFTVTLRTWEGGHRVYRGVLLEVQAWIDSLETSATPESATY